VKYRQWISLIILAISLYVFWKIHHILLLTFAAAVFAVVLNRAVILLQRWVASRKIAVLMIVMSGVMAVGGLGVIVVPPFSEQIQELIDLGACSGWGSSQKKRVQRE
jgi:predicted PurR-regulated permease PerM